MIAKCSDAFMLPAGLLTVQYPNAEEVWSNSLFTRMYISNRLEDLAHQALSMEDVWPVANTSFARAP